MTLRIENRNGRSSTYTASDIRREARWLAKGQGKLVSYTIVVPEARGDVSPHVEAVVETRDGPRTFRSVL
jgi:hypothetical protein